MLLLAAAAASAAWLVAGPADSFVRHELVPSVGSYLERSCPRPDLGHGPAAHGGITGILVAGGGIARVHEALRLARMLLEARLLFSIDAGRQVELARSQADLRHRLTIDQAARNTFENGRNLGALGQPRPGEKWLLVTSGVHMPRALAVFHTAGFDALPWPIYDLADRHAQTAVRVVAHEIAGLLAYRALGWTETLMPCPVSDRPVRDRRHMTKMLAE